VTYAGIAELCEMRFVSQSETLQSPPTEDEREAWQQYEIVAMSGISLVTYCIRRRELRAS
jgi:hypothetical protein